MGASNGVWVVFKLWLVVPVLPAGAECLLGNSNNTTGLATASVARLQTLLIASFPQVISFLMDLLV